MKYLRNLSDKKIKNLSKQFIMDKSFSRKLIR